MAKVTCVLGSYDNKKKHYYGTVNLRQVYLINHVSVKALKYRPNNYNTTFFCHFQIARKSAVSPCSTSDIRRVTLVTIPVMS